MHCVAIDLGDGDFAGLPGDFDYVLHFAVAKSPANFDADLRANAEGVGLLMSHCRDAKAFLHCSTDRRLRAGRARRLPARRIRSATTTA